MLAAHHGSTDAFSVTFTGWSSSTHVHLLRSVATHFITAVSVADSVSLDEGHELGTLAWTVAVSLVDDETRTLPLDDSHLSNANTSWYSDATVNVTVPTSVQLVFPFGRENTAPSYETVPAQS